MTPKEILMQYADLFKIRSIPAWIFRYVEQFLFRLLYGLANGMETMVNHLASILAFFNQPEVQDFYQILALASFVFLAIALMFQGYNFILGKRKTVSDLFRNTVLGVLFIIAIPWTMTQFLTIADASVASLGTDEEGNIMLAANVLYDNITDIEILAESGEWENLEARKNLSRELPFEALDLTEAADGEADVLGVKLVSTGDSVVDEELDNGGLFSFWDEYYFRYSYDFLVILLEFVSLIVIYIFFSFKLISVAFELATTKLVAPFAINTDIGTGQKAKVVLKEMINGFATFVSIFYILRLYQVFTSWILAMDLFDVPILNAIIMIVAAFVVIDGTKTIPRIFGFDAGVKDGQATLMGLYAGTRLGAALGRGTKGLANGIGNSMDYNADKLGKWNENRQEAGGIGNHLQNGMQDKMNSFKHPLQTAQNAMRSSDLAHSFAQGGFQQAQMNDLAMATGATLTNAGKALQLNGNDPEKAKTYLQQMGMTDPTEDQPGNTGVPIESKTGEPNVGNQKNESRTAGAQSEKTGEKDLNARMAERGTAKEKNPPPILPGKAETPSVPVGVGLSNGQSLNEMASTPSEAINAFEDNGFRGEEEPDVHLSGQKMQYQSVSGINQGNTHLERNMAINGNNEGLSTSVDTHVSSVSTGNRSRINSDGTMNVPRMENLLYEEEVSFPSIDPVHSSATSSKSTFESVESTSRTVGRVERNVEVRSQNDGIVEATKTNVSTAPNPVRTRMNSDGTLNVPRMEQIVEDYPSTSSRVHYEEALPASGQTSFQENLILNRSSADHSSKTFYRQLTQLHGPSSNRLRAESISKTGPFDQQNHAHKFRTYRQSTDTGNQTSQRE